MLTRRNSLQLMVAAALGSRFKRAYAQSVLSTPSTGDAACSSCTVSQPAVASQLSHVLTSAAFMRSASLPHPLEATLRVSSSGVPLEFVDSATGNLSFTTADLTVSTLPALILRRFYNSQSEADTGLGRGWSLDLDEAVILAMDGSSAQLTSGSGVKAQFVLDAASGNFLAQDRSFSKQADLRFVSSTTLEQASPTNKRSYPVIGGSFLLTRIDILGRGSVLLNRRTDGRLLSLTTLQVTAAIHLNWSVSSPDRLGGASDHTGRTIQYRYNGDTLVGFIDPSGALTSYSYQQNLLASVVDAEKTSLLKITYTNNRVASLRSASGLTTFSYALTPNGSTTTLTDAVGKPVSCTTAMDRSRLGRTANKPSTWSATLLVASRGSLPPAGWLLPTGTTARTV